MAQVGRLRRQDIVEQPPATQLTEQTAEALNAARLRLRLLFETTQNCRKERRRAAFRLRFAHAQLAGHRLKRACPGKNVGDLRKSAPLVGSIDRASNPGAQDRIAR